MSDIKFAYKGEARLIRWADSGGAGRTITIQLDEEGDVHPFKHMAWGSENGQRMQIAVALVDDHEQNLAPEHAGRRRKKAPKGNGPDVAGRTSARGPHAEPAKDQDRPRTPFRELKKAAQAALKLQDETFKNWLVDTYWTGKEEIGDYDGLLKRSLGIVSKSELDSNPYKGKLWDELLASFDYRAHA